MPWHGVVVATALPFRDDLTVDLDRYREHVRWLIASGCDGVSAMRNVRAPRCATFIRPGRSSSRFEDCRTNGKIPISIIISAVPGLLKVP